MSELIIQVFGTLGAGGAESRMMDVYRNIDKQHVQFAFVTLDKSKNQFYEKEIFEFFRKADLHGSCHFGSHSVVVCGWKVGTSSRRVSYIAL